MIVFFLEGVEAEEDDGVEEVEEEGVRAKVEVRE